MSSFDKLINLYEKQGRYEDAQRVRDAKANLQQTQEAKIATEQSSAELASQIDRTKETREAIDEKISDIKKMEEDSTKITVDIKGESEEIKASQEKITRARESTSIESRPTSLGGKPKEGSVGEALIKKAEESELWFLTQRASLREAGREMGEEAQQALQEGDYVEAALKGAAAFSARAGAGVIDATTIFRPLAIKETVTAIVETGVDVAQHPEKIPGSLATTIRNVAKDPGSLVEFGAGIAGDVVLGMGISEVGRRAGIVKTSVSRLDDLKVLVDSDTLKAVDKFDPITGTAYKSVQFPEAELLGITSKKRIPSEVSEIMAREALDQSGSMRLLGVATEEGVTALDRIELPISSSQFDELMKGKKISVADDVIVERVGLGSEKIFSVEDLADDMIIKTDKTKTIFGKTDDALAIDAKELGPSIKVFDEDVITTTTIKTIEELDTISLVDDLTSKKIDITEGAERKVVIEETPSTFKISELDESTPIKLQDDFIKPDDIVKKSKKITTEVDEGTKFGGPWGDEGKEVTLGEGTIKYDIKGQILEKSIDEVIDEIPRIEPIEGDPTPWAFTHEQPGYTEALRDLPEALKQDIDIVRKTTEGEMESPFFGTFDDTTTPPKTIMNDIVEGVTPVVKIIEDPIKVDTKILAVSRARRRRRIRGPPGQFAGVGTPPSYLPDYPTSEGLGLMPNPYFGEIEKLKDKAKFKVKAKDGERINDIIDDVVLQKGVFDVIPKTIPDVTPKTILDDITIPKDIPDIILKPDIIPDVLPKDVPDIILKPDIIPDVLPKQAPKIIPEQVMPDPPSIPFYPLYLEAPRPQKRIHIPDQRKLRPKRIKLEPLVGFEIKTTKMMKPEDIIGKKKKFRLPKI